MLKRSEALQRELGNGVCGRFCTLLSSPHMQSIDNRRKIVQFAMATEVPHESELGFPQLPVNVLEQVCLDACYHTR